MHSSRFAPFVVASLLLSSAADAAVFSDIFDGHPYEAEISALATAGVITGNPDGTFAPERSLNRAEMLAMLYRAAGHTPGAARTCFPDVGSTQWFASYVCDAVDRGYVAGHPDGLFRPGDPVNRAEALKMVQTVLDLPSSTSGIPYVDIPSDAWFSAYVRAAVAAEVLPIAGQEGYYFHPDWPLLRGEAAAYIHNALYGPLIGGSSSQSSVSVSSASTSSSSPPQRSSSSIASVPGTPSLSINLPFEGGGAFEAKRPSSFTFSVQSTTTVDIHSEITSNVGGLSCRLYRIDQQSGFSHEYHLGFEEGRRCRMRATLTQGEYHVQMQPQFADARFSVRIASGQGDGNDGFSEAKRLPKGVLQTATLVGNDYEDFYLFTVATETRMTVQVGGTDDPRCIVYVPKNVDLFGFVGPECNEPYDYPAGTYHVSVGRSIEFAATQTYTIRLK